MLLGAFGPWLKALGTSISGTDGSNDGWLVVGAAVIGGGVFLLTRNTHKAGIWAVLGGLAGAGVTIYDRQNISSKIDEVEGGFQGLVQIGWGLNLALVASISFGIAGIVWFREMRDPVTGELLQADPAPVPPAPPEDAFSTSRVAGEGPTNS